MKQSLKYAIIITSFSIIWKMGLYITHAQNTIFGKYYLFAYFLFILLGILYGIKAFIKNSETETSIGEKIKAGMKIGALNSLLFSAFIFVYYRWIDLNFFQQKINNNLLLMQSRNNTTKEIEQYMNTAKVLYSASSLFQATLFGFLVIGAIYAVICGMILHKKLVK